MTEDQIIFMARASGWMSEYESSTGFSAEAAFKFAALIASAERTACHQAMLDFIEEFMGYEKDRHPMFSEGYDLALFHMKKLIKGDKFEEENGC